MKNKRIAFFALVVFVFAMLVGCGPIGDSGTTTTNTTTDGKIIPSYEGMKIDGAQYFGKSDEETLTFKDKVSNRHMPNDGEVHKPDKNIENPTEDIVDIELDNEMKTSYQVDANTPFEIHLFFNNPDEFEIISFVINGKKFLAYQQGVRTVDVENIFVSWEGLPAGYHELEINEIKYIADTSIQKQSDVKYNGDRNITVSAASSQRAACEVSAYYNYNTFSIEGSYNFNKSVFDIDEAETYIAISDGTNLIYQDTLKEGQHYFNVPSVVPNTKYEIVTFAFYDVYNGLGKQKFVLSRDFVETYDLISTSVSSTSKSVKVNINYNSAIEIEDISIYEGSTENVPVDTINYRTGINEYEFDNLYSNTNYIVSVVFGYIVDGRQFYYYHDDSIKTKEFTQPRISFKKISATSDSLKVEVSASDIETVSSYEFTVFEKEDPSRLPVYKSYDFVTEIELTNLYSGKYYVFECAVIYDLNDQQGNKEKVFTNSFATTTKSSASFTFKNEMHGPDFLSFTTVVTDKDNILLSATLTVLDYLSGDVVYTKELEEFKTQAIKVEGLFSNKNYSVKVVYDYDKNDGTGTHTSTSSTKVMTTMEIHKPTPSIYVSRGTHDSLELYLSLGNDSSGVKSISTDLYLIDYDEFGYESKTFVDTYELQSGKNSFSALYSGREYYFDCSMIYNLYDGKGDQEITFDCRGYTRSYDTPYFYFYNEVLHYDRVEYDIEILYPETILDYQFYYARITDIYNEFTGTWSTSVEKLKEIDIKEGHNVVPILTDEKPYSYCLYGEYSYDLRDGRGIKTDSYATSLNYTNIITLKDLEVRHESADIKFDLNPDLIDKDYEILIGKTTYETFEDYNSAEDVISLGKLEPNVINTIENLKGGTLYSLFIKVPVLDDTAEGLYVVHYITYFHTQTYYEPSIYVDIVETTKTSATVKFNMSQMEGVLSYSVYLYRDLWDDRTQSNYQIIIQYIEDVYDGSKHTFENLYSDSHYCIGLDVEYKSSDGSAVLSKERSFLSSFNTKSLIKPEFKATNLIEGYNSLSFNLSIDDPDNTLVSYELNVYTDYGRFVKTLGQPKEGKVNVTDLSPFTNYYIDVTYKSDMNKEDDYYSSTERLIQNAYTGDSPSGLFHAENVKTTYDTLTFDFEINDPNKNLISYDVIVINYTKNTSYTYEKELVSGSNTIENLDAGTEYGVIIEYKYRNSSGIEKVSEWQLISRISTKKSGVPYVEVTGTSSTYHEISFTVDVMSDIAITSTKYILTNAQSGEVVAEVVDPENNTVVFSNLNACNDFYIYAEFTYLDSEGNIKTTERIEVLYTYTKGYLTPTFYANNVQISNNYIEFDFVMNDDDSLLIGDYQVKLYDNNGKLIKNLGKIDSGKQRIEGLFQSRYYRIEIEYSYDAKDGWGTINMKHLLVDFWTESTEYPSFKANHFYIDDDSISFNLIIDDKHNTIVGNYTLVIFSNNWEYERRITNPGEGTIRIDGLNSGTSYGAYIEYHYDLSSGGGVESSTSWIFPGSYVRTDSKTSVNIGANDIVVDYNEVSFDLTFNDPDSILTGMYYIEVRNEETGEVVQTIYDFSEGRNVIDLLNSNTHYSIKLVYNYNLNDGNGEIEGSYYIWSGYTRSHEPVDVSVNNILTSYDSITMNVTIDNEDGKMIDGVIIYVTDEYNNIIQEVIVYETQEIVINGLYSDTRYFVKISYFYDLDDGQGTQNVYRTIWSGSTKKYTPVKVNISNIEIDYEQITFDFYLEDVDNVLFGDYYVHLYTTDGQLVSTITNPENGTLTFEGLTTNTSYVIEVIYSYYLNDGVGDLTITETIWSGKTKEYGGVNVVIENIHTDENSITFTMNIEDESNILVSDVYVDVYSEKENKVIKTVKVENGKEIVIDGLLSDTHYYITVRYTIDKKDGNGEIEVANNYWYGSTKTYDNVSVEFLNFAFGIDYLTFDYYENNPNGLNVVSYIEIVDGQDGTTIKYTPILGSNIVEGLYSNRYYYINVYYSVDYNNGCSPDENHLDSIYNGYTFSYDEPEVSLENITADKTTISFDVVIDDEEGIITEIKATLINSHGNVDDEMIIDSAGTYKFTDTYSYESYSVLIEYSYDDNTGEIKTKANTFYVHTEGYEAPTLEIVNGKSTQTSISFDLNINDPNGFIKDIYIELYNNSSGHFVARLDDVKEKGNVFENLYSSCSYEIRIYYVFNTNRIEDEINTYYYWSSTQYCEPAHLNGYNFYNETNRELTIKLDISDPNNSLEKIEIIVYDFETNNFIKTYEFAINENGLYVIDDLISNKEYYFDILLYSYVNSYDGEYSLNTYEKIHYRTPELADAYFYVTQTDSYDDYAEFTLGCYDYDRTLAEGDIIVKIYNQDTEVIATFINPEIGQTLRVENLECNKQYYVDISYYVDRNDNKGISQAFCFSLIDTRHKAQPMVEFINVEFTHTTYEFEISISDPDDTLVSYEVYFQADNGEYILLEADENGKYKLEGLVRGRDYHVFVILNYDYGNSDGIQTTDCGTGFRTNDNISIPSGTFELIEVTDDSFTVEVNIDDQDNILENAYILINDTYKYYIDGSGTYTINNLGSDRYYNVYLYLEYDYGYGSGVEAFWVDTIDGGIITKPGEIAFPDQTHIDYNDYEYGYLTIRINSPYGKERITSGYIILRDANNREIGTYYLDDNLSVRIAVTPGTYYNFDAYIIFDGQTICPQTIHYGTYTSVFIRYKNAPTTSVDNVITHNNAASGTINMNDTDESVEGEVTYAIYYYDGFNEEYVFVKNFEVDENGKFVITGLDIYTNYYIFVTYSYDLQDGNGVQQMHENIFNFYTNGDLIQPKVQVSSITFNEGNTSMSANIQAGARKEYVLYYEVDVYDCYGQYIGKVKIEGNSGTILIDWLNSEVTNGYLVINVYYDCGDGTGVNHYEFTHWF